MGIGRTTWTDDSGNGTSGTVINNAALQAIYDEIDAYITTGSWTPTIGGSGGQSGQAYSKQVGQYIKIGRLVILWYNVQLSTLGTITGIVQIQGLPFTIQNVTNYLPSQAVGDWGNTTSSFYSLSLIGVLNTTTASLFGVKSASASPVAALAQADLAATSIFIGILSYLATS